MYDYYLPTPNFTTQYSLEIHRLGFINRLILPKSGSKRSSFSINAARNRNGIHFHSDEHEDLAFGEIRLKRDQSGENNEAEDMSIGEIFEIRAQEKDDKLVEQDSKSEELEIHRHRSSRRQMMRISNVMAKQVISIRSALSLGFVSQLWVDTSSWVVMVVEVKPNLLSGDFERFLLKQIKQVGDVILVEDENVIEDDIKFVGLQTLVGYTVVTPSRQSIGKVRGYNFNINSGTVESLELDSFGISIIPSSLVSTYALFVEDVLEVSSDTIVVHEAAMSRVHRLTKGFWDGQSAGISNDDQFEEQLDYHGKQDRRSVGYHTEKRRRKPSVRKSRPKTRRSVDDWELPMDYL
ncbi:hypothetical protein PHJA_000884300 [Phtheirospermum japonicum]|uniref:Uncharacterized protein n=1 Tax=Phtheirospermum japonicum TaxID=374723 RepID=A0A830BKL8_9LAMI|nr:hypothetical protein PHJA_000884300 [Phtheirospermum japonicum]